MNRPNATGAVTHGRVSTAGQAAQRRTVLDVEAAIEWARQYFGPQLFVFDGQKPVWTRDHRLHLEAMRHIGDLKCGGVVELWRQYISSVLRVALGVEHYDARDWIKGLSDLEMPPEVREYVCALLASVRRAMRKRGRRGPGQPPKRERDEVIRGAVQFLAIAGYKPTRSTWADKQTSYPHHVVEQALAHTVGNAVERAYRRSDLFEKRRRLMDQWASFCTKPAPAGIVTPIRRVG